MSNTRDVTTSADTPPARQNLPADAKRLIAHVRNDITIPYYTDVLRPTDETLIARGQGKGLAIYDEIERDPHAYAVIIKRKHELVAREWSIEPASDDAADAEVADFITDVFTALPFDRYCLELLDATLKGYAVSEIVWRRDGNRIVPEQIVSIDQRRIVFDEHWRPRLLTREAMLRGIELPAMKFIVHRFGAKGNDPYGLGLGTRLFWPVLFKREGFAFWLTFLEKYASPTPVAKVPIGMLPSEQRELMVALEGLVHSGAITLPIGAELDYLEAKRSAPANHEAWARYWDEQISEAVLGETLSTNIGKIGSLGAAEVHSEAKSQIIDADSDLLSDTLRSSIITWLVAKNFPGRAVPRCWRQRPKNEGAIADARQKQAAADTERVKALNFIVVAASHIEDEGDARAFLTAFDSVEGLPEEVVTALVKVSRRKVVATNDPTKAVVAALNAGGTGNPSDQGDGGDGSGTV
ncbi:DUF935 family protein [Aurantimonas sp. C2-6-R+9]|uniref:phage portal protein family protein n=1 Tax=unclassified Aurantimonas TaxID=2638230 RepID=UPI002E191B1F|nr:MULTISPECIES: DUF935 family protein [unclassified Aurantimonas]MEC5291984.1 DUF935 family protein [Aurantimonas sp. C2-3-R2]MEC5382096.1 DUF935 family protein [Aurantimonas sp. C2-6-R+9]MEC5413069.1 DUF935 family protein [Aurantimonas sp. C2-4-R8]